MSESEYATLHEFIRENRFEKNGGLEKLLEFIDVDQTKSLTSKLLVLHPPYPESDRPEEEVLIAWRDVHKRANATGYGCGKTDLLTLVEQAIEDQSRYNVASYLNNRELVTDGVDFYQDIFLDKLYELDHTLFQSIRHRIAELSDWLRIRLNQLALLVNTAAIPLAAIITYVLTLLGFDAFKFFVDPQNQQALASLATWFDQNQTTLYLVAIAGLVVWWLYAWAALQKDNAYKIWQDLSEELKAIDKTREIKEKLAGDQEKILKRLATKRRPLLLLIDDVDVVDSNSFNKLTALQRKAEESEKYVLLTILGYNPWNPTLYYKDRRMMRQELTLGRIKEKEWVSFELPVPTLSDIRTWLWGYYNHQVATDLLDTLDKEYAVISENPSLALAFFIRYDREQIQSKGDIVSIQQPEIELAFERFLNRDRRVARDIIQAINKHENAEGAIEMLKYILAYKKPKIRVDHLKAIMLTTEYKDFNTYEKILLSAELNLLRRDVMSGTVSVYVFCQPYLRSILRTSWENWRKNSSKYYSEVFAGIHRLFKRSRDDPELALEANPSQLAVDVLRRQGDYYYKYYGSSDAGFALKYYGLTRGGALGKWFSLCRDAIQNGDSLWKLMYWKGDAHRLNPKRHWSNEADDPWVFAPEIVLTAGKLYWLNGDWKKAKFIWEERWSYLFAELQQQPESNRDLVQRVNETNIEIQSALAEMLYEVGQPGHWEQAQEICKGLREKFVSELSGLLGSHLTLALINYYQAVGIGNYLSPYRFLRPENLPVGQLKKAANEIPSENPNRLRAFYVIADSLWQTLWSPTKPLPLQLEFGKIEPFEPDQDLWEQFTEVHGQQQRNLQELIEYRDSQGHNRLPGGRVQDGDLLYWEAMQWFMSARYFCLEAIQWFEKWPIFKTSLTRKMTQRVRSYYAVAIQLSDFCLKSLPTRKQPPLFAKKMNELQRAFDQWFSGDDYEDNLNRKTKTSVSHMLQTQKKGELRKMQSVIKKIVEELYQIGWSSILDEGFRRLKLAESTKKQILC